MYKTSGRWLLGFSLALTTAILWGMLPVAMKELLKGMEPLTVTWYRLSVAAIFTFFLLYSRGQLPKLGTIEKPSYLLLGISVLGLIGNYVFYLLGLNLLNPGTTQLMMQLGQLLLIISSVYIFKESFNGIQACAVVLLLTGFLLFFNQRLVEMLTSLNGYTKGILILMLSSLSWTIYGLCQKQLLIKLKSVQVMLIIYIGSSMLLFPTANPTAILSLTKLQFALLLFSCLNTIISYGAFAEALAHWEAYKVTATLAIAPLVTFTTAGICSYFWPDYVKAESLNLLSYFGALVVVTGSALVALSPVIMQTLKARRKKHIEARNTDS